MAGEISLKTPLTGLVTLVPTNTATDKTITLPATTGTMVVQDGTNTTTINNLAYTGTLTGGTGVINIGSGQVYKDAGGNFGVGTTSPQAKLSVSNSGAAGLEFYANYPGGGTGTYIQSYNRSGSAYVNTAYYANSHTFWANGDAMVIASTGNVGIGTASPNQRLQVVGSNSTGFAGATLQNSNGNVGLAGVQFSSDPTYSKAAIAQVRENPNGAGPLVFYVDSATDAADWSAGDEKMRISAAGNVGIGTSSPGYAAANRKVLAINGGSGSGEGTLLAFMQGGSNKGYVFSIGPDMEYWCESGTTTLGNNGASPIIFKTTNQERMRIDSAGGVAIGKQAASESYTSGSGFGFASPTNPFFSVVNLASSSNNACIYLNQRNTTSTNSLIVFLTNNGSSQASVGSIYHNGTNTTYATSSDYRLKNITGELTTSGTFIDALKPKVGTWKSNGSPFVGFLAHEFAEVSPSSVSGEKDAVDKNGNPEYQGMQASSSEVMANVIAELQSLRKRVAELENK